MAFCHTIYPLIRFYTSVKRMSILREKGVKVTVTVCEYMTNWCPLKDPKELRKMKRGLFDYKVDEGEEIIVCHWHNSSVVTICSIAVCMEPMRLTRRHSGATKTQAQVPQPWLVKLYREEARGVGWMDLNIAKYKVKLGHEEAPELHGTQHRCSTQQCVSATPDLLAGCCGGLCGPSEEQCEHVLVLTGVV